MSVTRHPEDRICQHPGCDTILCVYNEGPTCFPHRIQNRTAHLQLVNGLERERALRELEHMMAQHDQRIAA